MKLDRGTFDTLPLSLITTRTVESLAALQGTDLNVLRFRPNLVIEAIGDAAFPEDEWVGRDLTVGTTWMRIDKRDKRCVVVNVDPVTGRRDPTVLRAIAAHRDTCLGVYGSTVRGEWPSVTVAYALNEPLLDDQVCPMHAAPHGRGRGRDDDSRRSGMTSGDRRAWPWPRRRG